MIRTPTVHLDAISAKTLRKTYHGAIKAIWPALGALRQTAPNSRDFKNDVNALRQAEREHMDRIQRLEQVLFDLYMLYGSYLPKPVDGESGKCQSPDNP